MMKKSNKFTWRIVEFSKLKINDHYSPHFTIDGYYWRLRVFPRGNNIGDHFSVYIEACDYKIQTVNARITFTVVNQINEEDSVKKYVDQLEINANDRDWGFHDFMPLSNLTHPHRGFIVDDTIIVEVDVFASKHEADVDSQGVDQDARTVNNQGMADDSNAIEFCFDQVAMTMLKKLEDENAPPSVRIVDFKDIVSNNYVTIGAFIVPSSLESIAKELLVKHPDIGTGNSPFPYMNEMAFIVLCGALKSMDTTRSTEVTETLILKWRDAVRGALHSGFKIDILKDHLELVTYAYLATLAKNSGESKALKAIDVKVSVKRKELNSLIAQRAGMHKKIKTELWKTCEATAAKNFPGETYGYFSI
ncbi:hypothetical protein ACFE04_028535 [Oxalis oulophora]